MKTYAVSHVLYRIKGTGIEIYNHLICLDCMSIDEAIGTAIQRARIDHPSGDGWVAGDANVLMLVGTKQWEYVSQ